jgi:4-aminobutyrate aminotransferase-like enzyme
MIVLPCGTRSIRFRPTLTVGADLVAEGLARFERAVTGAEA